MSTEANRIAQHKRKAATMADESKAADAGVAALPMPVVSPEDWLTKRKALLAKEKTFSKLKDELARDRQALGMHAVSEDYVFQGPDGDKKLSELFGDHDQLIVVHFMFPPEWERGCSSCSLWADGYNGNLAHINRKAAFVAVGKAPIHKISSFKEWKGWAFPFYSSGKNTFNRDFGVEFTPDEVSSGAKLFNYGRTFPVTQGPGYSVFFKGPDGTVYHTYSTYARGMEQMSAVWGFFDVLPRGRDEKSNMDWLKHKEMYDAE